MAMPPTPNPRQPLRPSSPLVRYGLALLIAGLTVAIRWWLEPLVGSRHAFLGGNLAVALVAYRYGTGPALAALVAIGAAFFWLFVVPTADFRGAPAGPLFVVMFSLATAGILVWLISELDRSRREAQSKAESASNAEARLASSSTTPRPSSTSRISTAGFSSSTTNTADSSPT